MAGIGPAVAARPNARMRWAALLRPCHPGLSPPPPPQPAGKRSSAKLGPILLTARHIPQGRSSSWAGRPHRCHQWSSLEQTAGARGTLVGRARPPVSGGPGASRAVGVGRGRASLPCCEQARFPTHSPASLTGGRADLPLAALAVGVAGARLLHERGRAGGRGTGIGTSGGPAGRGAGRVSGGMSGAGR